jgi:hypothetical protein
MVHCLPFRAQTMGLLSSTETGHLSYVDVGYLMHVKAEILMNRDFYKRKPIDHVSLM